VKKKVAAKRSTRTRRSGSLERDARAGLREAGRSLARLERGAARAVAEAAGVVVAALESGGTVYFCGNGGSAADAQHLAAELSGRFLAERPALAAVSLTTNTSALTAIGNDFGFERLFARQLEGVGVAGDVLVAISTSGRSPNVVAAIETAHRQGMTVIGMTGSGGRDFAALCDVALVTPSDSTPRVQEGHITMGHVLCDLVERALFPARKRTARR
jgi:D-sedoheptulose 7-phosphate isomerase